MVASEELRAGLSRGNPRVRLGSATLQCHGTAWVVLDLFSFVKGVIVILAFPKARIALYVKGKKAMKFVR